MQLRVEYADGRIETIGTDSRWKTSTGPIIFDSIYGGETYDARAGEAGLGHAGLRRFRLAPGRGGSGPRRQAGRADDAAHQGRPDHQAGQAHRTASPASSSSTWARTSPASPSCACAARPARKVVMKYGERLGKDGMLDRADIQQHVVKVDTNQQFQTDTYILEGQGPRKPGTRASPITASSMSRSPASPASRRSTPCAASSSIRRFPWPASSSARTRC